MHALQGSGIVSIRDTVGITAGHYGGPFRDRHTHRGAQTGPARTGRDIPRASSAHRDKRAHREASIFRAAPYAGALGGMVWLPWHFGFRPWSSRTSRSRRRDLYAQHCAGAPARARGGTVLLLLDARESA